MSGFQISTSPSLRGRRLRTERRLWNLLIDNRSANNADILILDVNDATTQTQIATRIVTRQQFAAAHTFQTFAVPFTVDASRAGHIWEFRVYWLGGAYVREQAVGYVHIP